MWLKGTFDSSVSCQGSHAPSRDFPGKRMLGVVAERAILPVWGDSRIIASLTKAAAPLFLGSPVPGLRLSGIDGGEDAESVLYRRCGIEAQILTVLWTDHLNGLREPVSNAHG